MASGNNNNGNKGNKGSTLIAIVFLIIFGAIYFVSCGDTGSHQSAKDKYHMDYYDRSDGKRIWYHTN